MSEADPIPEYIVAEISRSWRGGEEILGDPARPIISVQFERVLAVNRARGYKLKSWNLTSVAYQTPHGTVITETIVAVLSGEELEG